MPQTTLRPAWPTDVDACSAILFDAFGAINDRHGFPRDFPEQGITRSMMAMLLSHPSVYGVVAEQGGKVVGSNFLWDCGAVAGIGPITVDPAVQGSCVGRQLMENVLAEASTRPFASVRLVQVAFNTISLSLYTKLGFAVREPLVCLQGTPKNPNIPGLAVRSVTTNDIEACCNLCRDVYGFDREIELRDAIKHGSATLVHRTDSSQTITAYATDIGVFGHAVAIDNASLITLIASAKQITGPGLLLPMRNTEAFRWSLSAGLRVVQPLTLMSTGLYADPKHPFLPSILF